MATFNRYVDGQSNQRDADVLVYITEKYQQRVTSIKISNGKRAANQVVDTDVRNRRCMFVFCGDGV